MAALEPAAMVLASALVIWEARAASLHCWQLAGLSVPPSAELVASQLP